MKILIVLTSNSKLGNSGKKTGFWLEEFAAPYYLFKDAGAQITLASPKGSLPPIDPKSQESSAQTKYTLRFQNDKQVQAALAKTEKLANLSAEDFDAIYYPGGHGPLWDLAEDQDSIALIESMYASGKPVAAVCHAPCVFRHAKTKNDTPLVKGKSVTSFSNTEEDEGKLTEFVPFLVEDMLKAKGGKYTKASNGKPHVIVDGNLITGQNSASSESIGKATLKLLSVHK